MGLPAREIAKLPNRYTVRIHLGGSTMARSAKSIGGKRARRGSALILTALIMIPLVAVVAFAVDWGRICVTKAELQRTADSAAMAGAWELRNAKGPANH